MHNKCTYVYFKYECSFFITSELDMHYVHVAVCQYVIEQYLQSYKWKASTEDPTDYKYLQVYQV